METTFPRIARFIGVDDAPGSRCPHCGAEGRYIIRFVTVDGKRGGAMRGCIKLFPVSAAANEDLRLSEKAKRYAKNGWSLNRADSAAVDALEAFFRGEVPESYALAVCRSARQANAARFKRR